MGTHVTNEYALAVQSLTTAETHTTERLDNRKSISFACDYLGCYGAKGSRRSLSQGGLLSVKSTSWVETLHLAQTARQKQNYGSQQV